MKGIRTALVPPGTLLLCAWACSVISAATPSTPLEFQTFLADTCTPDFTVRATLKPDPRLAGDKDEKGPVAEARLAFQWQPDSSGFCAAFSRKGICLLKVTQGRIKTLTSWQDWPVEPRPELPVAVQRRGPVMRVIVGHRVAAVASDPQYQNAGGKVGFGVSRPDLSWQSARYQRVGPIAFADDFMRAEGQQSPWETVTGKWDLVGVRGEPGVPSAAITANPFVYRGVADDKGQALCTTGYWFWDGYRMTAAVKPEAKGDIGLCAYYQSPTDYLRFRWSEGLAKGKRQLVAMLNGQEKVLAEAPGGHEPGQWYWLEVRVAGDAVEAYVDRELACRAKTNALGQGACGLWVAGKGMQAQFDDVTVAPLAASEPPTPFPQSNVIREHFVKDQFLKLWAEESAAWVRAPGESFWHKGD
ncbi:MAG: hypothetical protein FJ272_17165, partial [Planctomycetes bacterium]|nr:hypothetical protein [Planctomycetota bacterium]